MGIIDEVSVTATCVNCNVSETVSALDYGSIWSGSHWTGFDAFEKFTAEETGGEGNELPRIYAAACKECGEPAQVV